MTLSERLRAAAEAENLSDWVRVVCGVFVQWKNGGDLFEVRRYADIKKSKWGTIVPEAEEGWLTTRGHTRDAAIRAGLLALAEREEGR